MTRREILLTMPLHVLQPVRVRRVNVEPHNMLRAKTGIGKNLQGVLPNQVVLSFKALGDLAFERDADLTGGNQPARAFGGTSTE